MFLAVLFITKLPPLLSRSTTVLRRWARSGVEPDSGCIFWIRSQIWVFELKPDFEPDPDFSLNLKPKSKRNILVSGSG